MEIIEMNTVSKSFEGKPALDGLSMAVWQGDIYGFLGPNGAGKTTALRILLGVLKADSGAVSVLGLNPALEGSALRNIVNALPESHGFYSWMRPGAYLRFFGEAYGRSLSARQLSRFLEQVGLNPEEQRPIRAFSRGMKQRLGIARALLNEPKILFLDEPTNGLDPKGRREIHDLLSGLNRSQGMSIVLSTHILDDVERLCNRVGILHGGKLRYEGPLSGNSTAENIKYRIRTENGLTPAGDDVLPGVSILENSGEVFICEIRQGLKPSDVIRSFIENGLQVIEAEPVTSGLEQLYLSNTSGGLQ